MADHELSAAELKTLLESRAAVASADEPAAADPVGAAKTAERPAAPPPLPKELTRACGALAERWSRNCAAELPQLLHREAALETVAVSQVPYGEFRARLSNPVCFASLSVAGCDGPWVLEIGPSILFPMIDCMLGGGSQPATIVTRPLTDIERRLAGRVTRLFVRQLQLAWPPAIELQLAIDDVGGRAPASAVLADDELVVWIRLAVDVAGARGAINLSVPRQSLARSLALEEGAPSAPAATPE